MIGQVSNHINHPQNQSSTDFAPSATIVVHQSTHKYIPMVYLHKTQGKESQHSTVNLCCKAAPYALKFNFNALKIKLHLGGIWSISMVTISQGICNTIDSGIKTTCSLISQKTKNLKSIV